MTRLEANQSKPHPFSSTLIRNARRRTCSLRAQRLGKFLTSNGKACSSGPCPHPSLDSDIKPLCSVLDQKRHTHYSVRGKPSFGDWTPTQSDRFLMQSLLSHRVAVTQLLSQARQLSECPRIGCAGSKSTAFLAAAHLPICATSPQNTISESVIISHGSCASRATCVRCPWP
jgi:hypothetical protein